MAMLACAGILLGMGGAIFGVPMAGLLFAVLFYASFGALRRHDAADEQIEMLGSSTLHLPIFTLLNQSLSHSPGCAAGMSSRGKPLCSHSGYDIQA